MKRLTLNPGKNKREKKGIKRRAFLGMGLSGVAGASLPVFSSPGSPANPQPLSPADQGRRRYWERTEPFPEKMALLQKAWEQKNYRLVRALTDSIRNSALQAQADEGPVSLPVSEASDFALTEGLPEDWKQWAEGWRYYKVLTITETAGLSRTNDPVEVTLAFQADQVASLAREIRAATIYEAKIRELTSQVFSETNKDGIRMCQLTFLLDVTKSAGHQVLVFYGNPVAELPVYPSDLVTTGEGFRLSLENEFYKVNLSRQTGQIERIILKREHGMEFYSGGQGHGEPAGIDWAHDYTPEDHFQKFRISLWDECPDYEIIRGPVCTIVRRWGFPYSPLHPLFSPSRLLIDIEYRFYAGLPFFLKNGQMTAVKDFGVATIRDDEWVFTGQSFTDILWLDADGKLHTGAVPSDTQNNLWGIGFYNKDTRDCFMGIFLDHKASDGRTLAHSGSPLLHYQWHGQLWSRYPVRDAMMKEGTVLYEKNAYSVLPFTPEEGVNNIERLRKNLLAPLIVSAGKLRNAGSAEREAASPQLGRQGETKGTVAIKKLVWEALHLVKDPQLYKSDVSIVDLGLVQDVRVRIDVVTIVLAMPHRGRPLASYFDYGSNSVHSTPSKSIQDAVRSVPGVKKVVVEQSWYPAWNPGFITAEGREKLELDL